MAEKLKDLFFSSSFIDQLGDAIQRVYPGFDKGKFARLVCDSTWETKELKERMRHVAHYLRETLPEDYPDTLEILTKVAPSFHGFDAMVFPEYVGR